MADDYFGLLDDNRPVMAFGELLDIGIGRFRFVLLKRLLLLLTKRLIISIIKMSVLGSVLRALLPMMPKGKILIHLWNKLID